MTDLGALRAASRALEPERVIAALDRALSSWRDPRSTVRARLREAHPVFSAAVLDAGCERGLASWTAASLATLRGDEVPDSCRSPELTAVWLAGCIPTASLAALIPPLLVGSAVYLKPSSEDPVSPSLFRESLVEADEVVGRAVLLGTDAAVLAEADAVVVHGRDETVAELRQRVPPGRVFVAHGHRLSVAAVGSGIEIEEAAPALGLDVALYDGRGCLSPGWVLVEDRPSGRAEALARALAEELDRLSRTLARGRVAPAEEIWIRDRRGRAAVRRDSRLFVPERGTDWSVILEPPSSRPEAGMLRTVPVVPFPDLEELGDWCVGLAPHLSSLGEGGWGGRVPRPVEVVARAGGSRVCPLGCMQLPPIGWHHDGLATLASLVRHVDVERGKGRT